MITGTDTSRERGGRFWVGGGHPRDPHFWLQSERVGSPGTFQRGGTFVLQMDLRAFITLEPSGTTRTTQN